MEQLNTFPHTYNVLVKGPSAHRYAFLTPLVLEFELFDLFVGEAHHVVGQHGAVLDQLLDLYFFFFFRKTQTVWYTVKQVTPRNYYRDATCD